MEPADLSSLVLTIRPRRLNIHYKIFDDIICIYINSIRVNANIKIYNKHLGLLIYAVCKLRRLCFNAVNLVISKSIQSVHYWAVAIYTTVVRAHHRGFKCHKAIETTGLW